MSILDGIFGKPRIADSGEQQVLEEMNFMDALAEHAQWKARLQVLVDGSMPDSLDPVTLCRDDQCELGKWINGPGLQHFQHEPRFHQVRAEHAQFHFIAGNVVRHVQANERAQAEALMENDYKQITRKMVQSLTELNAQLKA